MDKKKVKPLLQVVDEEYENYLDLKKGDKHVKAMHAQFEKYAIAVPKNGDIFDFPAPITTSNSKHYYAMVDTTDGKAVIASMNKKPVSLTYKKIKAPKAILKFKKPPPPPKPPNRIIREEDFKFPRVRRENTLRAEKEPQVSMEEDEFRDIEALEIKI